MRVKPRNLVGCTKLCVRSQGGFGRNKHNPPFYVSFNSRDERDAARRSHGNSCLNRGQENHNQPRMLRQIHQPLPHDSPRCWRWHLMAPHKKPRQVSADGKNDFVNGYRHAPIETAIARDEVATVGWSPFRWHFDLVVFVRT